LRFFILEIHLVRYKTTSAALFLGCTLAISNVAAFAAPVAPASARASAARISSLGVTVVANRAGGVSTLTKAQVAGIFSGTITNWKQVGGADVPIHVIGRGSLPIESTFEKIYLDGAHLSASTATQGSASDDLAAVTLAAGAISFVYASDLGSAGTVRAIAVSDVRTTDTSGIVDLGTVSASTTNGSYQGAAQTASAVAPTQAGLDSTEAHSLITRDFIEESSSPIAEFTRIAAIAPSVSTAGKSGVGTTNGPGLTEQTLTIRGMSTDLTNVTFDGIPFSDTNDPSFHSTSFFPELLIGGVDVVRGPGNASDLGYATFGGSENMYSVAPSDSKSFDVSGSTGTFDTNQFGARYQSGRQSWLGGGTLMASYQDLTADGYLSNNYVKSANYALKYEVPLGDKTLLDVFGTVNSIYLNQSDAGFPDGATAYEQSLFGKNYSLNNLPGTANYYGYNFEAKATDFGYIRLRSDLGNNIHLDNKLYTYRYDNETTSTDALGTVAPSAGSTGLPSSGTLTCNAGLSVSQCANGIANGTNSDFTFNPDDIAGYLKRNKYFVVGDILEAKKTFSSGFIDAGVWLEHSSTDRHNYNIDLNNGEWDYAAGNGCDDLGNVVGGFSANGQGVLTPTSPSCAKNGLIDGNNGTTGPNTGLLANGTPIAATNFDQQSMIFNAQPFLEGQVTLRSGTTIYPGVRFVNITRYDDAQVESKVRAPENETISYHATLPFLSINQKITPKLSAFAQYGEGYEIPDIGTYYVANPTLSSRVPNESFTYQAGLVGKTDAFAWDADVYTVNFSNLVTSLKTDIDGALNCGMGPGLTGNPCNFSNFFNTGGAHYSGIELEATARLGAGFSLYGNYSTDSATDNASGLQEPNVPITTAAAGLLYKTRNLDWSAIYKMTGLQYLNTPPARDDANLASDLAAYNDPLNQIPRYGTLDLNVTWHVDANDTLQINGYNVLNATPLLTNGSTGSPTDTTLLISQAPASFLITFQRKLF
jgi:iron complex outermembrane recepter protein